MAQTLAQFLKTPPRKATPAPCGHVLDVMDQEGNYMFKGELSCADCHFTERERLAGEHPGGKPAPRGHTKD